MVLESYKFKGLLTGMSIDGVQVFYDELHPKSWILKFNFWGVVYEVRFHSV